MRTLIITALLSGAIGFVAGNAFWYLFSPLWIDTVVNEQIAAELTETTLKTGDFRDADASHRGEGKATLFESASGSRTLAFENFTVTNGPDLEVWLVKAVDPQISADVTASEWISLGTLKGNIGDQTYPLPADVDPADYGSVVIWCEQFGVLFAVASLN